MKKILNLLMSVLLFPLIMSAQSIDEVKNNIYYKRYTSAQHMLEGILSNNPANAEAWYLLTQSYVDENDDTLPKRLKNAPDNVQNEPYFQVAMGDMLLSEKKNDSALFFFERAIKETRSKDPGVLAAIANSHISNQAGDARKAVDLLKKAIKRDKGNPNTLLANSYSSALKWATPQMNRSILVALALF